MPSQYKPIMEMLPELPGYNVLKYLGSGGNGSAFQVECPNGTMAVLKVERPDIPNYKETPNETASEYFRALDFDEKVAQTGEGFLYLVDNIVIPNETYMHPRTNEFTGKSPERWERFKRKNGSPDLMCFVYKPVCDGSLSKVWRELSKDPDGFRDFFKQMLAIINHMRSAGFHQNDFGMSNIMYVIDQTMPFGRRWYLLDYGQIYHESYETSLLDEAMGRGVPNPVKTRGIQCNDFKALVCGYLLNHCLVFQEDENPMSSHETMEAITYFAPGELAVFDHLECPHFKVRAFRIMHPNIYMQITNNNDKKIIINPVFQSFVMLCVEKAKVAHNSYEDVINHPWLN